MFDVYFEMFLFTSLHLSILSVCLCLFAFICLPLSVCLHLCLLHVFCPLKKKHIQCKCVHICIIMISHSPSLIFFGKNNRVSFFFIFSQFSQFSQMIYTDLKRILLCLVPSTIHPCIFSHHYYFTLI